MAEIFAVPTRGIGLPDYSAPQPTGQVPVGPTWTITDVGELAARLGSIVTYDRRGRVVDFDNFEEPVLRWFAISAGTGSGIYLDSENAKSGSQSVKLVTSISAGNVASLRKNIAILGSVKLGIEISWSSLTPKTYLNIALHYYSGTKSKRAWVRLNTLGGKLEIMDSTANFKEVATGLALFDILFAFQTLKLVADFSADHYMRLLFGNTEYDLSSEALYTELNPTAPSVLSDIDITNQDAVSRYVWIDDVIWTQAEP